MHSRIFQVSRAPIDPDEYITEDRYFDGFVGYVADYVSEDTDREEDLKWLAEVLANVAEFERPDCFVITDKLAYFKNKYENWKILMGKMSKISLEQFAGMEDIKDMGFDFPELQMCDYQLRMAFEDKYSFYIDDNNEYFGNQTFDRFMRNTKNGDRWYIGKTLDYHS